MTAGGNDTMVGLARLMDRFDMKISETTDEQSVLAIVHWGANAQVVDSDLDGLRVRSKSATEAISDPARGTLLSGSPVRGIGHYPQHLPQVLLGHRGPGRHTPPIA